MGTDEKATTASDVETSGESAAASEPQVAARASRKRMILVHALITITTLLAIVGMLSVWANRLLFNPDNWENTSTQLLQNPDIRSATANYIVDQIYANVDVAALLRSGLPPRLDPLAAPAAGALRNAAVQGVELALTRPRVQDLWAKANRAADQAFIAVVNGGKGAVSVNGGAVTLDLSQIVNDVAARLGLPSGLGSKLPASIANLTVFKSNQLKAVQDIGDAVRSLALWLTILVPLLYAAAILLATGRRRRTLMEVGFAFVLAGIIGLAGRAILQSAVTNSLTNDEALRPAIRATVGIGTQILATIAGAFILVGAVLAVAGWFAGPARPAVAVRRMIAPFLREQPEATFGITIGVMALIFIWQPIPATGTPVGIVVFLALALLGTEVLRRQTAVEFPEAREGDTSAAIDAQLTALRDRRGASSAPATTESVPDQLERLATLRDNGTITTAEFDAAKANLLHV